MSNRDQPKALKLKLLWSWWQKCRKKVIHGFCAIKSCYWKNLFGIKIRTPWINLYKEKKPCGPYSVHPRFKKIDKICWHWFLEMLKKQVKKSLVCDEFVFVFVSDLEAERRTAMYTHRHTHKEERILSRRRRWRVVEALVLWSGGRRFKCSADHLVRLFLGSPEFRLFATLPPWYNQLGCLHPGLMIVCLFASDHSTWISTSKLK